MSAQQATTSDGPSRASLVYAVVLGPFRRRLPWTQSAITPTEAQQHRGTVDPDKSSNTAEYWIRERSSTTSARTSSGQSRPSSRGSTTSLPPGPRTPPPDYQSSVHTCTVDSESSACDGLDDKRLIEDASTDTLFNTPSVACHDKSDISWSWATQGLEILKICFRQRISSPHNSGTATEATTDSPTRASYIHALTYLLRALPADLRPDEVQSLRSALPPSLICTTASSSIGKAPRPVFRANIDSRPTLLHRTVCTITLLVVLLAAFLRPWLVSFFTFCHAYAQRHRLKERVISCCMLLMTLLLKQCLDLGSKSKNVFLRVNETYGGKLRADLEQIFWYTANSVTGGVYQGLNDGIGKISAAQVA